MSEFHKLSAKTIQGETITFDRYKNKVVLIVNTASKCGFTPQYEGLELLYKKYQNQGLEILGFPCNQFGNQEPDTNQAIKSGCLLNYGVTFQMFEKIEVNGTNTHNVYRYLKSKLSGFWGSKIKWNFTKFLIDKNGTPIKRYASYTKPQNIEKDIIRLLNQ